LLVTTALESSWDAERHTIFLGEWCKKFSRADAWENQNNLTVSYHWESRDKLKLDHNYLESLYEETLEILYKYLNAHHGLSLPKVSWRIIIGPWLYSFLPVIWDRWESISALKENHMCGSNQRLVTKALRGSIEQLVPADFNQFREFLDADWWNHLIFLEIIKFRSDLPIEILDSNQDIVTNKDFNNDPRSSISILRKILYLGLDLVDDMLSWLSSSNQRVVIFHSYFKRYFYLKLHYNMRIIPRWHGFLKSTNSLNSIPKSRTNLTAIKINTSSAFEIFLSKSILIHIPNCYLEGLSELITVSRSLPNTKVIHTANAYIYNERFKVWSAFQVAHNAKLIISSHGSAFYPLYNNFNHEEKISFLRVVWGETWLDNQVRLPANKIHFKIKNYKCDGQISLIDYEATRYGFRCASGPVGPLVLNVVNENIKLLGCLELNGLLGNVRIRVKGLNSWETKLRYQNAFDSNIFCSEKKQIDTIKKSKIIICTYPQTSFSEAMYSGVPTILFYDEELWEVQEIYHSLIKDLKENNIIFTDAQEAADHILSINNNPMMWWEMEHTISAREEFNNKCLTLTPNPLDQWTNFFQSLV
jgi:putative transferase (TIGR04331 family)